MYNGLFGFKSIGHVFGRENFQQPERFTLKRIASDENLKCSFCHKSQDAVSKLISSPSDYPRAYICD